jgi:hypothetical protein
MFSIALIDLKEKKTEYCCHLSSKGEAPEMRDG